MEIGGGMVLAVFTSNLDKILIKNKGIRKHLNGLQLVQLFSRAFASIFGEHKPDN